MLSKQQVDARVQAAIESLQAGRGVEDDAGIEFKGDWPDPAKNARQLAGAANALRGEPLLLVVGVHDSTGEITVPKRTEPQEWYSKVRKPFDQIPPELLWVQTVFVGERAESVQVLVFSTDEYPYVINSDNRREVPLRIGTATESAHRNQLVRMLDPLARTPAASITAAEVRAQWSSGDSPRDKQPYATLSLALKAGVFLGHLGDQPLTLPVRDIWVRLSCGDFEIRSRVEVESLGAGRGAYVIRKGEAPPPAPLPPQHGVYAKDGYVVAISPGEFKLTARHEHLERAQDRIDEFSTLTEPLSSFDEMRLDLQMRAVSVDRAIKITTILERTEAFRISKSGSSGHLGTFTMSARDQDPWEAHAESVANETGAPR